MSEKKEVYVPPTLVTHELLRDITAKRSGVSHGNSVFSHLFGHSHRH
jgi:hypothetical protein